MGRMDRMDLHPRYADFVHSVSQFPKIARSTVIPVVVAMETDFMAEEIQGLGFRV